MADRTPRPITITTDSGQRYHTPGVPTVFGLYITAVEPHGYTVTEPVSGLKVAAGSTPRHALRALRLIAQGLRREHGSFRGALDVYRREWAIREARP